MMKKSAPRALIDAASAPYRGAGGCPYHHARDFAQICCRALGAWRRLLDEHHFHAEAVPMSAGTAFANVLLIARPR